MSAKPSPEEPNTTTQAAADGSQAETRAPDDRRPEERDAKAGDQANDRGEQTETRTEEAPTPEASAAELESQIADLTDRLLRAHAEMDNVRKRSEREKAELAKYAISKFAADVVVLGDNFQRAVSAVPAGAAEQDATLKGLLDGVSMMEREFLNVLARHGVKRIDPNGQPFNPHLHQAVMEQQNPEVPNGTVVQVFQPGYTIEDRVLRPAMVVVAKGGPKPQPPEKPAAEPQGSAGQPESPTQDAAEGEGTNQPGGETNSE